jgi:hypothetical protein
MAQAASGRALTMHQTIPLIFAFGGNAVINFAGASPEATTGQTS